MSASKRLLLAQPNTPTSPPTPTMLTMLGSDYHGSQSHTYVPADVCPFR